MRTWLGTLATSAGVMAALLPAASGAQTQWQPPAGSWQLAAIQEIRTTFGATTFDDFIWSDAATLWAIRPSYGEKQNLLARTVCRSIAKSGQPSDQPITLKFYDTVAYRDGRLDEHASVLCEPPRQRAEQ